MAHEILSVKMYELDKKLEQTHSRIQLAESMVYDQVEAAVGKVLEAENINLKNKEPIFGNVLPGTEEKILTAEYALDFAMQAVNRALLVSLEAIEAQRLEEKKEVEE